MIILLFNQGNNRSSHSNASFMTKDSFFFSFTNDDRSIVNVWLFSDRHTHVSLFLIVFKVIILQSRQYIDAQAYIFVLIIIIKNIDCKFLAI